MDWMTLISSALISFGAVIMLINIVSHFLMIRAATEKSGKNTRITKTLIRSHLVFMAFFLLGYIAVLYLFLNNIKFASNLFVAVIFFFGAIFVFMGIVIQKRMLTAQRLNNEKLSQYNERLQREKKRLLDLNYKLQEEVEGRIKAEEADQMKSDFLSLVSHELRSPLTSIFGFTKLIKKRVASLRVENKQSFDKEKQRIDDNLNIISNECGRLTRLINNVLDLAKIESGNIDWNDRPIPLQELIGTAMAAVEGLFVENDTVTLELNIPVQLPTIQVDTDLFTQVLVNLINNAFKFTDKGIVTVAADFKMDSIQISVTDQGQGIAQDELENIFSKFHVVRSGDTLSGKKLGTGLGLPICKQIVEHYKGNIWAESQLTQGSTFYITLPCDLVV